MTGPPPGRPDGQRGVHPALAVAPRSTRSGRLRPALLAAPCAGAPGRQGLTTTAVLVPAAEPRAERIARGMTASTVVTRRSNPSPIQTPAPTPPGGPPTANRRKTPCAASSSSATSPARSTPPSKPTSTPQAPLDIHSIVPSAAGVGSVCRRDRPLRPYSWPSSRTIRQPALRRKPTRVYCDCRHDERPERVRVSPLGRARGCVAPNPGGALSKPATGRSHRCQASRSRWSNWSMCRGR